MTRRLLLVLVMLGSTLALGLAQEAQEPASWLAVQQCAIKPTEGQALRAALREYVDYLAAHPQDFRRGVLGAYKQRVNNTENFTIVLEVASIAEWATSQTAFREALAKDATRNELRQKYRSHLVPQSCNWSFHQPWP